MSESTPAQPLTEATMQAAADAAEKAFAAATNLEELAVVRREHLGMMPRSPRRGAASDPCLRSNARMRRIVNMARGRVEKRFAEVKAELERKRNEEVLRAERIDVTQPTTRGQLGAQHPITILSEQIADIFVGMGWEIADTGGGGRVLQLRFAELYPTTLRVRCRIRSISRRRVRARYCVRTPLPCRCERCYPARCRSTLPAQAVCSAPMNWMPPTPQCSTRSRPGRG